MSTIDLTRITQTHILRMTETQLVDYIDDAHAFFGERSVTGYTAWSRGELEREAFVQLDRVGCRAAVGEPIPATGDAQ